MKQLTLFPKPPPVRFARPTDAPPRLEGDTLAIYRLLVDAGWTPADAARRAIIDLDVWKDALIRPKTNWGRT